MLYEKKGFRVPTPSRTALRAIRPLRSEKLSEKRMNAKHYSKSGTNLRSSRTVATLHSCMIE